jgi:hypothetical protein
MNLEDAKKNIGRGVVYQAYPGAPEEDGVITSVNDSYVFVHYRRQYSGSAGQATNPKDLRFIGGQNESH